MTTRFSLPILFFVLCVFASNFTVSAQDVSADIDDILQEAYSSDGPSISILVAQNGKSIYKKAYGKANLELDVNATIDNVYELGSITKQFTAVAILMLEEEGKLNVQDDLTKYIPDYPTQGNTITIHHLLNHTSGIKSYTNMPSFMKIARQDMTPSELIDVFKNEPMEFSPGEQFNYNNSGYILLGHIIEVVSGVSYQDYIQTHIFDQLDMKHSLYGSKGKLISNRASGYSNQNGYVNANYLSMTLPYAAGSLMSTVEDMLIWQNAMSNSLLINKENYNRATQGSTLSNGENISYGFGWIEDNVQGSKSIQHGGGIFGYTTMGIYLPAEDVYVIGLTNCDCGNVTNLVTKVAAIAIGKAFPSKKDAITLTKSQLNQWKGAYEFDNGAVRFVTVENGQIYSQREGSVKMPIYPLSESRFIFEDGNIEYNFFMDGNKKVAKFITSSETYIGAESDRKPAAEREVIAVDVKVLESYEGKYELAPSFHIVVSTRDAKLFAQATGQPEFELFAESESKFFLKVVDAQIIFTKDDSGKVTTLTLYQGGAVMPGQKVE